MYLYELTHEAIQINHSVKLYQGACGMEKISGCVADSSNDTFSLKREAVAASLPDCDNDWLCPKRCQTKTNTPSQLHHVIRCCLQYLMIKVYVVLIATPQFGFSFDSDFTNLQVCF